MLMKKIKKLLNKAYLKLVTRLGNKVEVIPPKKPLYILRMGQVLASYNELTKCFGNPSVYKGVTKDIDIIWEIPITGSQVATIYSHKKAGNPIGITGIDQNIKTVWNIGGQSKLAVIFVYSVMGKSIGSLKTKLR